MVETGPDNKPAIRIENPAGLEKVLGQNESVTKNRVDLTKGFVDSSNEGSDLSTLLGMQEMKDPREAFYLFDDGFHTPALKKPSHPSFRLNDLREQAITQARFPDESPGATNKGIVEQLLQIVEARK